jgi:hypothetical protein
MMTTRSRSILGVTLLVLALGTPLRAQAPDRKTVETAGRAAERSLDRAQACCRSLPVASKPREDCFATSNRAALHIAQGQEALEELELSTALDAFREADTLARKALASCPGSGSTTDPLKLIGRLETRSKALATRLAKAEEAGAKAPADALHDERITRARELYTNLQEALRIARTHLAAGQPQEATRVIGEAERLAHEAAGIGLTRGH